MLLVTNKQAFSNTLAMPRLIKFKILASIIKTIEFCGHQNLPLDGHHDNFYIIDIEIANHSNFGLC